MTSPINSRGMFIPPEYLFCPKLAPAVLHTWAQIRSLADENSKLYLPGGIQQLAVISSKSTQTLYGHLAALRDMCALTWRASQAGELFVTFDDKGFSAYVSKILSTSLINNLTVSQNSADRKEIKEAVSKTLESKRDPLLEHPAVKAHRGIMHLTANALQRKMIAEKVGDNQQAWVDTLEHWAGHGWSPTNIIGMLDSLNRGGKAACTLCNGGNGKYKGVKAHKLPKENDFRRYNIPGEDGDDVP